MLTLRRGRDGRRHDRRRRPAHAHRRGQEDRGRVLRRRRRRAHRRRVAAGAARCRRRAAQVGRPRRRPQPRRRPPVAGAAGAPAGSRAEPAGGGPAVPPAGCAVAGPLGRWSVPRRRRFALARWCVTVLCVARSCRPGAVADAREMRAFTAAAVQVAPTPGPLTARAIKSNVDSASMVRALRRGDRRRAGGAARVGSTGFTPGVAAEELWDLVDVVPGASPSRCRRWPRGWACTWSSAPTSAAPSRGTVYNAAVLIGPAGDVLGVYRKTHLVLHARTAAGGGWVTPGDGACVVRHRPRHGSA